MMVKRKKKAIRGKHYDTDQITGSVTRSSKHGYVELQNKRRGQGVQETLAADITDAMDPTRQSRRCETTTDNNEPMQRGEQTVVIQYLRVGKRTEKAVLVSFGSHRKWLPTNLITFREGCRVEIPKWLALVKGLYKEESKRWGDGSEA